MSVLEERLSSLDALVAQNALGAGVVVPEIGRALGAFAEGSYGVCASILESVAPDVVRIGGSAAQREVFEDTLLAAYMRSGEVKKALHLLDKRLHRRPSPRDARWRKEVVAGIPS